MVRKKAIRFNPLLLLAGIAACLKSGFRDNASLWDTTDSGLASLEWECGPVCEVLTGEDSFSILAASKNATKEVLESVFHRTAEAIRQDKSDSHLAPRALEKLTEIATDLVPTSVKQISHELDPAYFHQDAIVAAPVRYASIEERAALWEQLQRPENRGWRQWARDDGRRRWNSLARTIGGAYAQYATYEGKPSNHPLRQAAMKLGDEHPLRNAPLVAGGDLLMPRAIDMLRELKNIQSQSPALSELLDDQVLVPKYYPSDTRWQKDLSGDWLLLIQGCTALKETHGQGSIGRRAQAVTRYLRDQIGWEPDNAAVHESFQRAQRAARQGDGASDAVQVARRAYTSSFRLAAGLDVPSNELEGLVPSQFAELFEQYSSHPVVKIISNATDFVFGHQAEAMREALRQIEDVEQVWRDYHHNEAYTDELRRRRINNEPCHEGCSCQDRPYFQSDMCQELNHIGEEGRSAKRSLPRRRGQLLNPSEYTAAQLRAQRDVLERICRFAHALATQSDADEGGPGTHAVLQRMIRQVAQLEAVELQSGGRCPVSGLEINKSTLRGNEAHHPTECVDLMIGEFVFVTSKSNQITDIQRMAFNDLFVDALFRELTVTRTIDGRVHQPIWHWMMSPANRANLAARGIEIAYPFEEVVVTVGGRRRRVLRYMGEPSDLGIDPAHLAAHADENNVIAIGQGWVGLDGLDSNAFPPALARRDAPLGNTDSSDGEEDSKPPARALSDGDEEDSKPPARAWSGASLSDMDSSDGEEATAPQQKKQRRESTASVATTAPRVSFDEQTRESRQHQAAGASLFEEQMIEFRRHQAARASLDQQHPTPAPTPRGAVDPMEVESAYSSSPAPTPRGAVEPRRVSMEEEATGQEARHLDPLNPQNPDLPGEAVNARALQEGDIVYVWRMGNWQHARVIDTSRWPIRAETFDPESSQQENRTIAIFPGSTNVRMKSKWIRKSPPPGL